MGIVCHIRLFQSGSRFVCRTFPPTGNSKLGHSPQYYAIIVFLRISVRSHSKSGKVIKEKLNDSIGISIGGRDHSSLYQVNGTLTRKKGNNVGRVDSTSEILILIKDNFISCNTSTLSLIFFKI